MPKRNPHSAFVRWKVNVDYEIAARVEILLWDPVLRKPRYASRSDLINELLKNWLEAGKGQDPTPSLIPSAL